MKPTPQISRNQGGPRLDSGVPCEPKSFPLTDYSLQATVEAPASSSADLPKTELRAFRKVSNEFFGAEASRDYIAELLFFIVITAISAWPIVSMFVAVTRLVRNY
jgi:hypothetical protein